MARTATFCNKEQGMKQYRLLGVSLAAIVALAGCADPSTMTEPEREVLRGKDSLSGSFGSGSTDFANAVRANMASHIVDPAPVYAENAPQADGAVIIGAYGRYRTDKVKPPSPIGVDTN
jgi:hypothetical protein